jgi:hypothetical protein
MVSVLNADGGRAGAQDISRSVWELLPSLDHADELLFLFNEDSQKMSIPQYLRLLNVRGAYK